MRYGPGNGFEVAGDFQRWYATDCALQKTQLHARNASEVARRAMDHNTLIELAAKKQISDLQDRVAALEEQLGTGGPYRGHSPRPRRYSSRPRLCPSRPACPGSCMCRISPDTGEYLTE